MGMSLALDDDDSHPANQILSLDSPDNRYDGKYTDFPVVQKSKNGYDSPQQMPGNAHVPLQFKAKALETKVNPGDASKLPLMPMRHDKDKDSVEYIDKKDVRTRRQAYEVTMAGTMLRGSKGEVPAVFDTEAIKKTFFGKPGMGAARLYETEAQGLKFRQLSDEWNAKSLIWVCTPEPGRLGAVFYSSVGRIDKFHHSSFTSGGSLLGAGEWIVEGGKLLKISANSGHYMPTLGEFHRAVMFMQPAWNQDTTVMLFDKTADNWEYVPVSYFKVDMTGGGKYIVHPSTK